MKTNSTHTQQEILLMTNTHFSHNQWCANHDPENNNGLTDTEQMEEACWNGMLREMLPEICEEPADGERVYLWQVREASSFLEIELGALPMEKENYFSIDPYSFMPVQLYN